MCPLLSSLWVFFFGENSSWSVLEVKGLICIDYDFIFVLVFQIYARVDITNSINRRNKSSQGLKLVRWNENIHVVNVFGDHHSILHHLSDKTQAITLRSHDVVRLPHFGFVLARVSDFKCSLFVPALKRKLYKRRVLIAWVENKEKQRNKNESVGSCVDGFSWYMSEFSPCSRYTG